MCPRIRRGVGLWVQISWRTALARDTFWAPLRTIFQSCLCSFLQVLMNSSNLPFGFQFDLKLRDVEVLGIVQVPEQHDVH